MFSVETRPRRRANRSDSTGDNAPVLSDNNVADGTRTHGERVVLAAAGDERALHGDDLAGLGPADGSGMQRRWWGLTNFAKRLVNCVRLRIITERGRELRWVLARRLSRR